MENLSDEKILKIQEAHMRSMAKISENTDTPVIKILRERLKRLKKDKEHYKNDIVALDKLYKELKK